MPASNPLDMIVAMANALKQQADALLLFAASLEPIQSDPAPAPTDAPVPASPPGAPRRTFRTFDDEGRRDVLGAPAPDSSGDIRPTSSE